MARSLTAASQPCAPPWTGVVTQLCVQDVLVVTAPGSGAEIIPYLKTYVNLPLAFLFTIGYSQVRRARATSCWCAVTCSGASAAQARAYSNSALLQPVRAPQRRLAPAALKACFTTSSRPDRWLVPHALSSTLGRARKALTRHPAFAATALCFEAAAPRTRALLCTLQSSALHTRA